MLSLLICIFEELSNSKYVNRLKISEKIMELKSELHSFDNLKIISTFLFSFKFAISENLIFERI